VTTPGAAIADLLEHQRFTFIEGDTRSAADLAKAFAPKPEAVLHLSWPAALRGLDAGMRRFVAAVLV